MGEGTSNPPEVAYTGWVEGDEHGMDGGREEAMNPEPVLVREPELAQGDVGDELVGVVVEGSVQAVEAGNGHTHRVDPSRMEEGHSFHIGSEGGEVHTWQADQVGGCDSGVKGVAAVAAQFARTSNCHDGHTVYDQRVVGSGRSG